MFGIGRGWPEKLVRIRLLNWEWKLELEPRNLELAADLADQESGFGVGFAKRENGADDRISEKEREK